MTKDEWEGKGEGRRRYGEELESPAGICPPGVHFIGAGFSYETRIEPTRVQSMLIEMLAGRGGSGGLGRGC